VIKGDNFEKFQGILKG